MPPTAASALVGKPLPDFSRRTLDGQRVDTVSFRGRTVVIKFFAKYCAPCQKTLPALEALHQRHPDLAIVGVAEDEHQADVEDVVSRYSLTFPVVYDAENVLAGRYRVNALPAAFVADLNGTVRWAGAEEAAAQDFEWIATLE